MNLEDKNNKNNLANFDNKQFYGHVQQEYKILSEYKMIESEHISGVYVIPSYKSSLFWFGVIFIRTGSYTDGIFRFNISLPAKFPDDKECPAIIFESNVIHPLICPYTNRLDISYAFKEWISTENRIWQILKYIQFIFEHVNECVPAKLSSPAEAVGVTSSLTNGNCINQKLPNQNAAIMLENDRVTYLSKVKECIRVGRDQLYDPPATDDKHYITFDRFEKDIHGSTLESIRKNQINGSSISPPTTSGVSWLCS